jgi:hypothetical protein
MLAMHFYSRGKAKYLIERQHRTGHLATIVQGHAHPVVDLQYKSDDAIEHTELIGPDSPGFAV